VIAKNRREPVLQAGADSQRAFAQRAGQWQNDYMVDFKMAWNHYFAARADAPSKARLVPGLLP
jgi:hypothetical protein